MSVTTIPLLEDIQGPWHPFRVEVAGTMVELNTVYPFTSVTDLKRQIWIHKNGDPRWAPERVFIGVRAGADTLRPIEFHWPFAVDLPDPTMHREPQTALVDAAGVRRPVSPVMIGSLILETALSPEILSSGAIPIVTAICLADLRLDDIPLALFGGYYQLYFPWLTTPAQILDSGAASPAITAAYAAAFPYVEDRIGRIELVQRALTTAMTKSVSMNNMTRLRWTLPPPAAKPLSLERTFYGLTATETIPFIRYFPAAGTVGQTPLLKLALKSDGAPVIDDPKLYAQFLSQHAPTIKSAVIMARIPLATNPKIAFVLFMFEDGSCDLTLEVPQRGTTYIAAVAADAQMLLPSVVKALGFSADTQPMLRDLHATFKWMHPRTTAPLSAERIRTRVAALTPFLEPAASSKATKTSDALAMFQWRAVSNYESESAQFAYITQMVLNKPTGDADGPDMIRIFGAELAERFGLTKDAAGALMERWIERRGEAVSPVAGRIASAVAKHSTGASVSITGTHPEYILDIQGADSYEELQRLLSVVGVLLGAPASELRIVAPAPVIQAAAAAVAIADAGLEEDADGGEDEELDPALAALMADLGFGGDGGGDEEGEEGDEGDEGGGGGGDDSDEEGASGPALQIEEIGAAAPPPDLDAAVAAVEDECRGTPWAAGEPALKITADYYMAKLKKQDKVMFGYSSTATGRVKTYSKSCQRQDGRQPNIMTLAEYARVQRCYEGLVRFANLPPRKPSDLPQDPKYSPTRRLPDEYFLTDHTPGPTLGKPLWPVYGYESKSRPGEFLYLICAELWCDRDNLPLLPSEFEGTEGRGFSKKPMTCPFCRGRTIADMEHPMAGESVIVRKVKGATNKLHRFVGAITRNKHPNGYELPCCDTTPRLLQKYMKSAFYGKSAAGVDDDVERPEPAPELGIVPVTDVPVDYKAILSAMQSQYILDQITSLRPGKISRLTPELDRFFGQDSRRAMAPQSHTAIQVDHLFLLMGVGTQPLAPGLNLFAGLAPLLGFDTVDACRAHFLQQRMVHAFESANYGNLVHEFAAKSTLTEEELRKSLAEFAGTEGYKLDANRPHVVRLYRAWTAYLKMLADNRAPKRLRHIEHLLAQPGVITPDGLLLVVLEKQGDEIKVVCPSFGIPKAHLFDDVPIAFMWHDVRDERWEPLIMYNGTKEATYLFGDSQMRRLPATVKSDIQKWLHDWRSSSLGCGRATPPPHVWTPDRDTRDLPRLTNLLYRVDGYTPKTLVRDRSNRLAGVLFGATVATAAAPPLFVPCLDDGNLAANYPRVFEAEMIPSAPIDAYLRFYQIVSQKYKGLVPTTALFRTSAEGESRIIGFRTAAGTVVPVAPAALGSSGLPEQQIDQLPWERDALILRRPDVAMTDRIVMEEATASVDEQVAEAYQYLRLTMSNWLASSRDPRGPAMATTLAEILNSPLPLYEKRKRCDILLEPIIREWLIIETTAERKTLAILREDCLSLEKEACTGGCSWTEGDDGRCLIHVPRREDATDPVRIFTARISDELLRYSSKRYELLNQKVQTIRKPRGAVRIGDELIMSGTMERLGFFDQAGERFPEEMLRFEGMEEDEGETGEDNEEESEGEKAVLPATWTERGLLLITGPTKQVSFVEGSATPLAKWEERIRASRPKFGIPDGPITWNTADWYIIANKILCDILFVSRDHGSWTIDRWIKMKVQPGLQASYMIFYNDSIIMLNPELYRFKKSELPAELAQVLDAASPMEEAEMLAGSEEMPPLEKAVPEKAVPEKADEEIPALVVEEVKAPATLAETVGAVDATLTAAIDAASASVKKAITGERGKFAI